MVIHLTNQSIRLILIIQLMHIFTRKIRGIGGITNYQLCHFYNLTSNVTFFIK